MYIIIIIVHTSIMSCFCFSILSSLLNSNLDDYNEIKLKLLMYKLCTCTCMYIELFTRYTRTSLIVDTPYKGHNKKPPYKDRFNGILSNEELHQYISTSKERTTSI